MPMAYIIKCVKPKLKRIYFCKVYINKSRKYKLKFLVVFSIEIKSKKLHFLDYVWVKIEVIDNVKITMIEHFEDQNV